MITGARSAHQKIITNFWIDRARSARSWARSARVDPNKRRRFSNLKPPGRRFERKVCGSPSVKVVHFQRFKISKFVRSFVRFRSFVRSFVRSWAVFFAGLVKIIRAGHVKFVENCCYQRIAPFGVRKISPVWESSETDPAKVCVFGENNSSYQIFFGSFSKRGTQRKMNN